jgi:putative ABC transport system permease protein
MWRRARKNLDDLEDDIREHDLYGTTLAIRTIEDPLSVAPSLRTLLSGIDRTQPLFDVKPLDVALAESIAPRRLNLLMLGTFALSALLLALAALRHE